MRLRLPVLVLASLLAAVASAEPLDSTAFEARVTAAPAPATLTLADGRTVLVDGLIFPVPEDDGDAAAADRAAAAAHAAVLAAIVGRGAAIHPLRAGADRWGRLPADVFRAGDDAWLQGLLLAEGHARVEACPRGDGARLERLRGAEAMARAARVGLWALRPYWVRQADRPMQPKGFAVVEGRVLATGGGGRMRYLNFAQDWREDFTLRAERAVERGLERAGIGFVSLVGERVRARGWMIYRNGPMLHISCPQQIEAIPE